MMVHAHSVDSHIHHLQSMGNVLHAPPLIVETVIQIREVFAYSVLKVLLLIILIASVREFVIVTSVTSALNLQVSVVNV